MCEGLNKKNYVRCEKHDIFFNKHLQEEADEENKRLKESGLLERVAACPLCKQEFTMAVLSLGPREPSRLEECGGDEMFSTLPGTRRDLITLKKR